MTKYNEERNGKIELLRFVFAVFIVIYHYGGYLGGGKISIGKNGYWGVEYFFIISGFFFAKSAKINKRKLTYDHTWGYMADKYLYYIKYYLIALLLIVIKRVIVKDSLKSVLYNLMCSIPQMMLLGQLGFNNSEYYPNSYYVSTSWYLSTLFIVLFVCSPIIYYNYNFFVKNVAPLVIMSSFSFLLLNFGKISVAFEPLKVGVAGLIRGACEICIGCVIYEVSKYIKSNWRTKILEGVLYACVFSFMMVDIDPSIEFSMLIITSFAVLHTVADKNVGKCFNNIIVYYLGRLSAPLLLLHTPIIELWLVCVKGNCYEMQNRIIIFVIVMLISMLAMFIVENINTIFFSYHVKS